MPLLRNKAAAAAQSEQQRAQDINQNQSKQQQVVEKEQSNKLDSGKSNQNREQDEQQLQEEEARAGADADDQEEDQEAIGIAEEEQQQQEEEEEEDEQQEEEQQQDQEDAKSKIYDTRNKTKFQPKTSYLTRPLNVPQKTQKNMLSSFDIDKMKENQRFAILRNVMQSFLYIPNVTLPVLNDYLQKYIEIKISAEFLSKMNRPYLQRQIWGQDIYTSDSDPICALHHAGIINLQQDPPLEAKNFIGIKAYFRVQKGRSTYNSGIKNGLCSRKRSQFEGNSIKPQCFKFTQSFGTKQQIKAAALKMPVFQRIVPKRVKKVPPRIQKMYQVQNRIAYDMCNQPAFVFSLQELLFRESFGNQKLCEMLLSNVFIFETAIKKERFQISLISIGSAKNQDLEIFKEQPSNSEDQERILKTINSLVQDWELRLTRIENPKFKDLKWMKERKIPVQGQTVIIEQFKWRDVVWNYNGFAIRRDGNEDFVYKDVWIYKYLLRN